MLDRHEMILPYHTLYELPPPSWRSAVGGETVRMADGQPVFNLLSRQDPVDSDCGSTWFLLPVRIRSRKSPR